jgi:DNA-binding GntR family transcriptional regulator
MTTPPEHHRRRIPRPLPIRLTKAELAYQQLREEILNGTLAPGTPLDQIALAMRIGLSTTPVREALRRLESERLVVGRAHHNAAVADLSPDVLAATYAVRQRLDPLAVSMAAAGASDGALATIGELARTDPPTAAVERIEHNRAVHRAIYRACGNEVLIEILDLLWDRSHRFRLLASDDAPDAADVHAEHIAIADAVASREAAIAANLMAAHIRALTHRIRTSSHFAGC